MCSCLFFFYNCYYHIAIIMSAFLPVHFSVTAFVRLAFLSVVLSLSHIHRQKVSHPNPSLQCFYSQMHDLWGRLAVFSHFPQLFQWYVGLPSDKCKPSPVLTFVGTEILFWRLTLCLRVHLQSFGRWDCELISQSSGQLPSRSLPVHPSILSLSLHPHIGHSSIHHTVPPSFISCLLKERSPKVRFPLPVYIYFFKVLLRHCC